MDKGKKLESDVNKVVVLQVESHHVAIFQESYNSEKS